MILNLKIINNETPKYLQLLNGIIDAIQNGKLKKGQKIPSLNQIMTCYGLSQDTVLRTYNLLKAQGIITSQVGKGYYIASTDIVHKHKLFILFDNFSLYKEDLYNAMLNKIGTRGELDIFFHHNKADLFFQQINNAAGNYSSYIIMPMLSEKTDQYLLDKLPLKQVYILDRISPLLAKKYPFVCQDFKHDALNALSQNISRLSKYNKIIFINNNNRTHIKEIEKGVYAFSEKHSISYFKTVYSDAFKIKKQSLIFCISDRDLVKILLKAKENDMIPGKDFGIISYNENQLKKVMADGITTVSTDFEEMGNTIINLVLKKERKRIYNKSLFNIRNSI